MRYVKWNYYSIAFHNNEHWKKYKKILHIVLYTLYSIHCIVYTVYYTLYTIQCMVVDTGYHRGFITVAFDTRAVSPWFMGSVFFLCPGC